MYFWISFAAATSNGYVRLCSFGLIYKTLPLLGTVVCHHSLRRGWERQLVSHNDLTDDMYQKNTKAHGYTTNRRLNDRWLQPQRKKWAKHVSNMFKPFQGNSSQVCTVCRLISGAPNLSELCHCCVFLLIWSQSALGPRHGSSRTSTARLRSNTSKRPRAVKTLGLIEFLIDFNVLYMLYM
jgi:hypothetical protein